MFDCHIDFGFSTLYYIPSVEVFNPYKPWPKNYFTSIQSFIWKASPNPFTHP
jgi:hypothetical protein